MKRATRLDPVRRRAGQILLRWRGGGDHVEELLESAERVDRERGVEMHPDARRRLRELLFGLMHLLGRYEFAIARRSRRSGKLADPAWASLLIGLHELFQMRTPDHAAIAQAVELCRALGGDRQTAFVNGVLRSVQRDGLEHGFPEAARDPIGYASSWLSHPRWLVQRWADAVGVEEMLALCEFDNRRRPLTLRCRPGEREGLVERFREREWACEPSALGPDALRLEPGVPVGALLAAFGSEVAVQDEAAQLVAPLVAAEAPASVLDLCAAPGGKALHLRDLLPQSRLLVADSSSRRMQRLIENFGRLNAHASMLIQDGAHPAILPGSVDAVLLDAPCSGTGVLARRHDARWRRTPQQLQQLVGLQSRLAESAVACLRPGGILVYATCALEPEENDDLVDALLAGNPELEEIGVEGLSPAATLRRGRLAVWPQRHGCDGAFAARLRRRS